MMMRQSQARTAIAIEEPTLLVAPPAPTEGERRRAPRVPARLLVRCPRNRALSGRTRDVSSSGAFLETPSRPPVGSEYEITLTVSERLVPAMVQVARHAADGVGLTFTMPTSPLEEVLARLSDEVLL